MATLKSLAVASTCAMLALTGFAWSQTSAEVPPSLITPDKVETRLGTLDFKNGAPSAETVAKDLRQSRLHACLRRVREHLSGR
jgi:hypothetical protein